MGTEIERVQSIKLQFSPLTIVRLAPQSLEPDFSTVANQRIEIMKFREFKTDKLVLQIRVPFLPDPRIRF